MSMLARAILIAYASCACAQISFRGSAQMKKEDVKDVLNQELADHGERLAKLERELSKMFISLPKNSEGRIGHQSVRYALHRYFIHSRGWFIRGLEPGEAEWTPQRLPNGELPPAFVKEWIPAYMQDTLENTLGGRGAALHDVAAMAAALEDLIQKEVQQRLQMVYDVLHVPQTGKIERQKADEVLMTYFMTFLLANNVTAKDQHDIEVKRARFTKRYAGYEEAKEWYTKTVVERLGDSNDTVDFNSVSAVVQDIGNKYHKFNDLECNDLRSTLRKVESRRPGRVRLSAFYNMTKFTHWKFIEKAEYLKSLGTLDETDPKNPSVIIANYVMGRQNCLEGTNLYAICCRNACEDLTAYLEERIGTASAPADRIAGLVSELSSQTVAAPRQLSQLLLGRLEEIAQHNGGEVPLHGRLFSQWMHHAYPLECPYPHQAGSINPQTVDEWLRDSASSATTSDEERQRIVEGDVCAVNWEGKVECSDEQVDLPWNLDEELLTAGDTSSADFGAEFRTGFLMRLALLILICAAGLTIQQGLGENRGDLRQALSSKPVRVFVTLIIATLSFMTGFLDASVFMLALLTVLGFYVASLFAARNRGKGSFMLPKHGKACW